MVTGSFVTALGAKNVQNLLNISICKDKSRYQQHLREAINSGQIELKAVSAEIDLLRIAVNADQAPTVESSAAKQTLNAAGLNLTFAGVKLQESGRKVDDALSRQVAA